MADEENKPENVPEYVKEIAKQIFVQSIGSRLASLPSPDREFTEGAPELLSGSTSTAFLADFVEVGSGMKFNFNFKPKLP